MTKEETKKFEDLLIEIRDIRINKSKDYGNSWKVFGIMGIIYQIGSKFIRIWNLRDKDPKNESLRDSFRDMSIYALMAIQLLDSNETESKI